MLSLAVFKGFEILWDSFSRSVVAILAIAVTALMAALVHVLRTNRDGISMTLAAFVGLPGSKVGRNPLVNPERLQESCEEWGLRPDWCENYNHLQ